jgi:hypothetical protein
MSVAPPARRRSLPGRIAGRWKPLLSWLAFLGLTLWFILTAPANRAEADDAYLYAHWVEDLSFRDTFDVPLSPLHVLYVPVMQILFRTLRALGIVDRPFAMMAIVSALAAAGALLVFARLLRRRMGLSGRAALTGSAILAVTYGFWRYAAEVELYSISILLAVATLYVAMDPDIGRRRAAAAGTLAAAASLFHTMNLLVAVVAVPVYLLRARRPRVLWSYAAGLVPVIAVVVVGAFFLADPGVGILTFYSNGGDQTGFGLLPNDFPHAVVGFGQLLVSGNFLFSYGPVTDRLADWFPHRNFGDEVFAGDHTASIVSWVAPFTLGLAVVVLLIAGVVAAARWSRDIGRPQVLGLASWLASHTIVLLVMRESLDQPEVWMLALPPTVALLVYGLEKPDREARHWKEYLPIVLAGALLAHNLVGGLAPMYGTGGDRMHQKSAWLLENAGSEDVILTADGANYFRYLRYQSDAEVIALQRVGGRHDLSLAEVRAAVESTTGTVYLSGDVFDPPVDYLERRPDEFAALLEFAASLEPVSRMVIDDEFGGVFVLDR